MEDAREAFLEMGRSLVLMGKICMLSALGLIMGFSAGAITGSLAGALILFRAGQGIPTNLTFHIGDAGLAKVWCTSDANDSECVASSDTDPLVSAATAASASHVSETDADLQPSQPDPDLHKKHA